MVKRRALGSGRVLFLVLASACSSSSGATGSPDAAAPRPDAAVEPADAGGPTSQLSVTVEVGTGGGTVTSDRAGIDCGSICAATYASGTEVVLTASPPGGSSLVGWRGDGIGCGRSLTCAVVMSRDRRVGALFAKDGTAGWAQALGMSEPNAVVDRNGYLVVSMSFSGSTTFGGKTYDSRGFGDVLLAKLSPAGDPVWVKQLGGEGAEFVEALAVDSPSGDVVVAGGYRSQHLDLGGPTALGGDGDDIFLARYASADGAWLWQKRVATTEGNGSALNTLFGLGVDQHGNVLVAGRFYGSIDLGMGPLAVGDAQAAFIGKLDGASGDAMWRKHIGNDGQGFFSPNALVVDSHDDFIAGGDCGGNVDFADDGPTGNLPTKGLSDGCLAKLSGEDGHLLWQQAIGGTGSESLPSLALGPHDAVTAIVQYQVMTGEDVTVLGHKLDGDGTGSDTVVARLAAADGGFVWARRFGGAGFEQGNFVSPVANGDVLITGGFTASFDMDAITVSFSGTQEDSFYALLDSDAGAVTYATRVGSLDFDRGTRAVMFGLTIYGFGDVRGEGTFLGKTITPPPSSGVGYGFQVTLP